MERFTGHASPIIFMNNTQLKQFCTQLLRADTENDVISILKEAGFWDNADAWRLYGDKEGNFAQAGNQQALPEAAFVEKIVNSCDSRLMDECLKRSIDPESNDAPQSVRDAVAMFFEGRRAENNEAGTLRNWSSEKRTEQSRYITIAATGGRPTRGRRAVNMCLTIVDQGEGQSGRRLPKTILSLNAKNKQRIRFVQGKFNMGGSGALRFCGRSGLQLVISKRDPVLAGEDRVSDPSIDQWCFTVVRREQPSAKSGEPIHSEFTYLAPVGSDQSPRHGEVLTFEADALPLMPVADEPYKREISWGTAIKLYEYETSVGQSNVLMADGLLYSLERLLPEIALPVRLHECRGYAGAKERSFETPIAGLVARLEDGKGDNVEEGFPDSAVMQMDSMQMKARIYAFKADRAGTYLRDEGVIFTINGQAHGHLPKSIFSRPRAVGLPRLKDSLLVLVDCSSLSAMQREDLFMSSRDRLSKKELRYRVEEEIEELLRENPKLRKLQEQRRLEDVELKLSEEKPLEEVLQRIFKASPTLQSLFLLGRRLARPFHKNAGGENGDGAGPDKGKTTFQGRRHPTYFRLPTASSGKVFNRGCEEGRRTRVKFETDVENEYFDRAVDTGMFDLEVLESSREVSSPNFSITLDDGTANLNMALPPEAEPGDELVLQATVVDSTLLEPLVNVFRLHVGPKHVHKAGPKSEKQPKRGGGNGEKPDRQGIALPPVIPVKEGDKHWVKYKFTPETACHVISDPIEGTTQIQHTFYINVDNRSLKTEMKYGKQDPRLLEAKFKYANVLIGLAILHDARKSGANDRGADEDQGEESTPQNLIRRATTAISPVILPVIDQLSGLSEETLDEISERGEDL
jgi:hypothetical protein